MIEGYLREAIQQGASSVHVEGAGVRMRVDGVLHPMTELAEPRAALERLRAMAEIDGGLKTGSGRFVLAFGGARYELSVSMLVGQSATVHIRPQRGRYFPDFTFDALGLGGDDRARMERALARPGLVVLAGPTRSGKQPVLYAALASRADGSRKVFSIEWVLRDRLPGIDQVVVDDSIGYGFPAYLRAAGHMDVDVLGIGELVDIETADHAMRFVARGKTAITTMHVPNAGGVFQRLVNMMVEPYLVAEYVGLVQAQRLVRLVCCEAGCERCHGRRFRGMALVVESVEVTPAVRDLIVRGKFDEIRGPRTLREGALELAAAGRTTKAEALLVTP